MLQFDVKFKGAKVRAAESSLTQMRVYFEYQGETIMDDLQRRRMRPHEHLKQVLPEAFKACKIKMPPEHSVTWSQRAGCQCGCSPGFIVSSEFGKDMWVKVRVKVVDDGKG